MIQNVKVKANYVGLAFKNGKLEKILDAGSHWLWGGYEVEIYDLTKPFLSNERLDVLLKNEDLKNRLEVITVGENEIALKFRKNLLQGVLTSGQYSFWKEGLEHKFELLKVDGDASPDVPVALLEHAVLAPYIRKYSVSNNNKGLLYIDNKFVKLLESGNYYWWKNHYNIAIVIVDTRLQLADINGQELLTKDKAAVRINFYARFRVTDMLKAVAENTDYQRQLYTLVQLALREAVSALTLDELMLKKENLGIEIISQVKPKANDLGLSVLDGGIKDIILPGDVKEIMNQVLIAEKKAQANIIMRREETASTRSLLNTANLMKENEMLWKLKEMEYVEKIAEKIGEISISGSGNIVGQLKEIFTK